VNQFERLVLPYLPKTGLAREFDPDFYRAMHADLVLFDDAAATLHYERHGRSEGRIASPAGHRLGFVAQIPESGLVLEIGPAVRPVLLGPHVRYFEVTTRDGLIERAIRENYPHEGCPTIHYVSPTGDLSIINDRFTSVFSSHCIEHQPDLIEHLNKVSSILTSGGKYFVIVPDKRYCFDALLPESTIDDVIDAHKERRCVHTIRSILDHYVETTHNETNQHWQGDSADPRSHQKKERTATALNIHAEANGGYVDVHAWKFTPHSFTNIINSLDNILLRLECVHHTIYGSNEFFAVLSKIG
jgi:hypothetical protein